MNKVAGLTIGVLCLAGWPCVAQNAGAIPDPPTPRAATVSSMGYAPPTQAERFRNYVMHTFSLTSLLEAGVRGGIGQAIDRPMQWPEGAEGFGQRMGSAMGEIALRGTTEYAIADLFKEDLRRSRSRCSGPCSQSALVRAFDDTFTARKGEDGHRAFSMARFAGPVAAGTIAKEAWYPRGTTNSYVAAEVGLNYGFTFVRSYIREIAHR